MNSHAKQDERARKRGFVSIGQINSKLLYNERKRKGSGCEADIYISDALCVNKYRIIFKMEVKGNGYIFKSRQ